MTEPKNIPGVEKITLIVSEHQNYNDGAVLECPAALEVQISPISSIISFSRTKSLSNFHHIFSCVLCFCIPTVACPILFNTAADF